MPKTFAFSNKGNFWKTRYSFTPSHYSHVNKYLYSYPMQVQTDTEVDDNGTPIPYLHHYGSTICNWYGIQSTSAVAFTFNDNVSTNKMYRSLSIEGTDNVNGAAQLVINNSRSGNQVKTTSSLNFRDRGGVLYSALEGSQQRSNKNIVTLGTIIYTDVVAGSYDPVAGTITLSLEFDWVRGAKAKLYNSGTQTTALFTVNQGVITKFGLESELGDEATIANANWQDADTTLLNTDVRFPVYDDESGEYFLVGGSNFGGRNTFYVNLNLSDAGFDVLPEGQDAAIEQILEYMVVAWGDTYGEEDEPYNDGYGVQIVAMTPDNVNGAKPQGQYADMVLTLGNEDYEIYAFNAYYEPNTLDHSK